MLSSLIVLSAFMGPNRSTSIQNPQFPKPELEMPIALQDASIFKYLSPEDKQSQWKPLEVGRDWSNIDVPTLKPNAIKLKVLLAVAERDFSDPDFSNTLEMRDKTRLLEAVGRLKSLFAIVSEGTINLEIVPRFIPEPIYDIRELKQIINAEFNKSKFESDDSTERGPFAGVLAISSSHVTDQAEPGEDYVVHGMSDLGGSGQDMWFEEGLFYVIQSEIFGRLSNHFGGFKASLTTQDFKTLLMDRLSSMRGEYQQFFDPNFRQDGELLTKWAQQSFRAQGRPFKVSEMSVLQSPAKVTGSEGILTYNELSILRAGEFALPSSSKWGTQKALKFEVRTKNRNPIALKLWMKDGSKQESVIGFEPGMMSFASDNNWQAITIPFRSQEVIGATIGSPTSFVGKTRMRSELVQCDFRNFELVSDAGVSSAATNPNAVPLDNEQAIKEALATGTRSTKRKILRNLEVLKGFKGLEPTLLASSGELDAGVAHDATRAYFELILAGQPTVEQFASMSKLLIAPPNEAAREVALIYVAKNPAYAKFDTVIGNVVRDSWRVRRAATFALGALQRANTKEKEGCHQMLLSSTSQEMAVIRLAALSQLDPASKEDNQRLEYLMVNDPCESVRLACLRILAAGNHVSKEKLMGSLADDSPTLRERIPAALGLISPYLREALQKMVVDQDPYVRLSAIQNFAVLGNVQDGEIQNLMADKHPSVQIAVLQGALKGAWKIPADVLARLKESPIPAVKTLAMEIK